MKKQHILLLFAAVTFMAPYVGVAQHGLSYNQFGQLRNSLNGSLSMMDPDGGATLLTRQQWVGVDGAPQSYWASGHVGIRKLGMTVGVDLKQVSLGVSKNREMGAYVASAVRLSEDEYLGLSVGGGLLLHNGSYSSLESGGDPNEDPSFMHDSRYSQGMVSLGISYFREDRYYFGVSIPRFVLNKRGMDRDYDFRRVYYITGGFLWRLDDGFHLRPSFIVSHMENDGPRYDVNTLAFFAQKFGMGVGVQSQGDLSGLVQLNIGDFGIGYSYQFNPGAATSNMRVSKNTHEVGIRYRVGGVKML